MFAKRNRRLLAIMLALAGALFATRPAFAYVEAPFSLGRIVNESTVITIMRVEKLDNEKNAIIFRKVKDLKGTHPTEEIKHNIGKGGFHPREWQTIMAWAAPGKTAVFFHNGKASQTFISNYWYQTTNRGGEWWTMTHAEPYLLRSFAGQPEKLVDAVTSMLAGEEVIVPCMVDGDKNALQLRTARLQRVRASTKLVTYDPQRDFVGWGTDEFQRIANMPGFTHEGQIPRVDPDAWGIATADINGDGMADLCLFGEDRVVLLLSTGTSMEEVSLPYTGGARAAAFGDYNGDGRPDLLLGTPAGLRLLANQDGIFIDQSKSLPREAYHNVTAAAWIDYDGDGRQDILLGNGFLGLRLYRNKETIGPAVVAAPKLGKWSLIGPFDDTERKGFDTVYPPEKEIALDKQYEGKGGAKVAWREAEFADGQVHSLLSHFKPEERDNAAVYLYREIEAAAAMELPASFGSDDTLSVWLNGEQIISEKGDRSAAPDQNAATLKLKAGKNALLIKICNGGGDWAYYFEARPAPPALPRVVFEDVSTSVGLGIDGVGATVKGDRLLVADVNGDGRQDFLYSAGTGLLALNTGNGFAESKDSGISFQAGRVTPVFGDCNGDKAIDLFVPQAAGGKLFRNDGKGKFTDVTAQSGDLAKLDGRCTSAALVAGKNGMDLVVGRVGAPNQFFTAKGDGTFTDASRKVGLSERIFNTRALCLVDVNKDGIPDLVLNNEGQDGVVLLGK